MGPFDVSADKFPKAAESFCTLERKEPVLKIGYKAFTEVFQDLCFIMALIGSPSLGRDLVVGTSS